MKNVRNLRYTFRLVASLLAALRNRTVGWVSRDTLRAGWRPAFLIACAICMVSHTSAHGQDLLASGTPSGSAVPNVSVNARNLGFSVRAGHEAGNVVGREQSASVLSVAPYAKIGDSMFIIDTRLLYGNEGEVAWSFGGAYRRYVPAWDAVVGAYGFHDFDQLTGTRFRQWSFGAEVLTHDFEIRGNYYRPYSDTSALVSQVIDSSTAVFTGNQVTFTQINTFSEALEGFDAEIGRLLPGELAERMNLRVFGGGYSYSGEGTDQFSGFSARVQADLFDRLELGLKVTDDERFNTSVAFNATVHFGSFVSQEHTSRSAIQRLAEPIRRNLNIASVVADTPVPGVVATNAAGAPLTIIHVDSNAPAGGTGTVENPFNSLFTGSLVPGADALFVHAGSTFNAPPDNTLNLMPNQSVFGEGLIPFGVENRRVVNTVAIQGLGDLILPDSPTFAANLAALGPDPFGPLPANTPLDPLLMRPILDGALGNGITNNTNSTVSGLIISNAAGNGILIDNVDGSSVRDTLITNAGGAGILIQNQLDGTTATILDTIITNATGPAFHVNGGSGNIGFTSTSTLLDPAFAAIMNTAQEAVLIENRTGGSVNLFGSTIDDTGGAGIVIRDSISNVTIDNANIQNSTGTGISITNSTGNFTFLDTVRAATTIDQAAGASVLIDGLTAGSSVTFQNLSITNPLNGGIDIDNLAGTFSFAQDLTIGAPGAGALPAPAISVVDSAATGVVSLFGDVIVLGSSGQGVELAGNVAGSTFDILGSLSVTNAAAQSISIQNNAGTFAVNGGTAITNRNAIGIDIDNSTGAITFLGGTTVGNPNGFLLVDNTGITVDNSESQVTFDTLTVTNDFGAGIRLTNNQAGPAGPGEFFAGILTVDTTFDEGLNATDTSSVRIDDGTITTVFDEAVNIQDSGININLTAVNSQQSFQSGITLVNTNVPGFQTFTVTGDGGMLQNGSGGTITLSLESGVTLRNAGNVTLNRMNIINNNFGIFVRNTGLAVDDNQFLSLEFSQVSNNSIRGIDSLNLSNLNIEDSIFDLNGNNPVTLPDPDGVLVGANRETIFLNYNELLNDENTTLFSQFTNPYVVNIERTIINPADDDGIEIRNDVAAVGAHLDVNLIDTTFTLTDGAALIVPDLADAALFVDWNGVAQINAVNNVINANGLLLNETTTGFDIRNASPTDETIVSIVSNAIPLTVARTTTGINLETNAMLNALIQNNLFEFLGANSIGLQGDVGPNTNVSLLDNSFQFLNDGGTGVLFTMVDTPAAFLISNNLISLTDIALVGQEQGIIFQTVIGTPTLAGPLDNVIELLNPIVIGGIPSNINVDFSIPQAAGQILINGGLRP